MILGAMTFGFTACNDDDDDFNNSKQQAQEQIGAQVDPNDPFPTFEDCYKMYFDMDISQAVELFEQHGW